MQVLFDHNKTISFELIIRSGDGINLIQKKNSKNITDELL